MYKNFLYLCSTQSKWYTFTLSFTDYSNKRYNQGYEDGYTDGYEDHDDYDFSDNCDCDYDNDFDF